MRGLLPVGTVALIFGVGSFYTAPSAGPGLFTWINLGGGALALLLAAASALRGRSDASPASRRLLVRSLLWVLVALIVAMGAEQLGRRSGWQLDATAERRYSLAPATRAALEALPAPVEAILFLDRLDTRARSSRLLLQTLAGSGVVTVRESDLDESADQAERFGVVSSNTVVLVRGNRFETVERPTEGSLFEALQHLGRSAERRVYVARGAGEGDLVRSDDVGYSGLAAALQTESYSLHDWVTAAASEVPADADAVLFVAPRRGLRQPVLAALERYLQGGGRLVALLEPGTHTGLEELLERWGFGLADAVVVDPASGPVEGDPAGVNPIVFSYAEHPAVAGLNASRMTFFLRARPVDGVRKPRPEDDLRTLAFASRRSWLAPNVEAVQRGLAPERPEDAEENYWPLLAVGRYPRGDREARIAVFGDSDFASNRYLRAVYNLDLLMNTLHWVTEREPAITLRPKALTVDQFPLTVQDSLSMFYGVGLVVPELCLIAAALLWARRRIG